MKLAFPVLTLTVTVNFALLSCSEYNENEAVELSELESLKNEMNVIRAKIDENERELEKIEEEIDRKQLNRVRPRFKLDQIPPLEEEPSPPTKDQRAQQVGELKPNPVASRLTSLVRIHILQSRPRSRIGLSCL